MLHRVALQLSVGLIHRILQQKLKVAATLKFLELFQAQLHQAIQAVELQAI
jgi:hypothetical protein